MKNMEEKQRSANQIQDSKVSSERKSGQEGWGGGEAGAGGGDESDTVHEEDPNDEKTWWTGDQTHEAKVHVLEMKTMERRKGQLLKYKIVNYQINERPDKNEEEVV